MDKAVKIAVNALDSRKGLDIEILRVEEVSSMADYFIICSGTSNTQIRTLGDEVEFKLKEELGIEPLHREGYQSASWYLLDYGFMIVHVFHQEARNFYNLGRLWADAERIDPASMIEGEKENEV